MIEDSIISRQRWTTIYSQNISNRWQDILHMVILLLFPGWDFLHRDVFQRKKAKQTLHIIKPHMFTVPQINEG